MEASGWVLGAIAALPAAAMWCASRWWHGRQRARLVSQLDKSERARHVAIQQALQARRQVEKLQTELSEYRRASSPTAVQREKARKLQAAVDAAVPVAAVSAEEAAARGTPAHGFADTLPM